MTLDLTTTLDQSCTTAWSSVQQPLPWHPWKQFLATSSQDRERNCLTLIWRRFGLSISVPRDHVLVPLIKKTIAHQTVLAGKDLLEIVTRMLTAREIWFAATQSNQRRKFAPMASTMNAMGLLPLAVPKLELVALHLIVLVGGRKCATSAEPQREHVSQPKQWTCQTKCVFSQRPVCRTVIVQRNILWVKDTVTMQPWHAAQSLMSHLGVIVTVCAQLASAIWTATPAKTQFSPSRMKGSSGWTIMSLQATVVDILPLSGMPTRMLWSLHSLIRTKLSWCNRTWISTLVERTTETIHGHGLMGLTLTTGAGGTVHQLQTTGAIQKPTISATTAVIPQCVLGALLPRLMPWSGLPSTASLVISWILPSILTVTQPLSSQAIQLRCQPLLQLQHLFQLPHQLPHLVMSLSSRMIATFGQTMNMFLLQTVGVTWHPSTVKMKTMRFWPLSLSTKGVWSCSIPIFFLVVRMVALITGSGLMALTLLTPTGNRSLALIPGTMI